MSLCSKCDREYKLEWFNGCLLADVLNSGFHFDGLR